MFKSENEITVRLKCSAAELARQLEAEGYRRGDIFQMDDFYFVPKDLKLGELSPREILSRAVLVREIEDMEKKEYTRKLTFKIKEINPEGEILNQTAINCTVYNIEEAKNFLEAIGYTELMEIKEADCVYWDGEFGVAIKDVKGGDTLIEIETSEEYDTIQKLISRLEQTTIPYFKDDYFVKKAEVELERKDRYFRLNSR